MWMLLSLSTSIARVYGVLIVARPDPLGRALRRAVTPGDGELT
jgi:hypothetical protein